MYLVRKNEVIQADNIDFINELKAQGFIEQIIEEKEIVEEKPKPKAKK